MLGFYAQPGQPSCEVTSEWTPETELVLCLTLHLYSTDVLTEREAICST